MKPGLKKKLEEVSQKLEETVITLKSEFFGIDQQIDQLARLATPFFVDPAQFSSRPFVINIWGMTGVGKTRLVERFTELMGVADITFKFDMGEYTGSGGGYDLKDKLVNLGKNIEKTDRGTILVMDEVQHLRSKDEESKEISNPTSRVLWEIIDRGTVSDTEFSKWKTRMINKWLVKAKFALLHGIKAKKNVIVAETPKWAALAGINVDTKTKTKTIPFIPINTMLLFANLYPDYFLETIPGSKDIVELAREKEPWDMGDYTNFEGSIESILFHDVFCKAEAIATEQSAFSWTKRMIEQVNTQETYEFKPLMVIVMGNLDEAYTVSQEISHEVSVETIYLSSLLVGLSSVKEALLSRFRSEQIARLGHNHIIYPALSEESYRKIIQKEMDRSSATFKATYGIDLKYDDTVEELIFNEVVAPAQGARCVITGTIALLDSYTPRFATLAVTNNEKHKLSVSFDEEPETYTVTGSKWKETLPVFLQIKTKKSPLTGDEVYRTAVHEAGHAICMVAVTGKLPDNASCVANSFNLGYVGAKFEIATNYSKALSTIAVYLSGNVAETSVFGKGLTSLGNNSDVTKATALAHSIVGFCGMGEKFRGRTYKLAFPTERQFVSEPAQIEVEAEIQSILDKGLDKAKSTIMENKYQMLKFAELLITKKRLNGKEIERFFAENPLKDVQTSDSLQAIFENAIYAETSSPELKVK